MIGISVNAYIRRGMEVTVKLQKNSRGRRVVIESGELSLFISSRKKLLEVVSLLEQAAQEWEEES